MILITGANGLAGSFICRKLLELNEPFKALVRPGADFSLIEDIRHRITIIEGDILDISSLEKAFEAVDEVIHCAAIVSFGKGTEQMMYKVNVEGTQNIANISLQRNIKRFCYLSSIAAIGRDSKAGQIDENTKWVESELNSQYARSKYLAELEVWRCAEEGLPVIIFCPSIIIGPGDWNKSSTKIFKNIHEGMRFYPSGSVNMVDVRDVASAVCLGLRSDISGERYVISGHAMTYYDFFVEIALGFGNKPPNIKLTKQMIMPFYYILKIFAPWYLRKRFINKETITISNSVFNYANKKFITHFNFSYRPATESIKWACDGLLKMNRL